ncbi:MAG: rhodanese-like domain-containing protein [Saprospiraceae bacterium]
MLSTFLSAQYTKTAACKDQAFDRKVNSYLSYSAPVISVVAAHANKSQMVFLDAREYAEYKISHIPGARYVGYDDFDIKSIKDLATKSNIVVYCSIGYRSEKIATKLKKEGYTNVYNLYGSLFEWANEGFELTDNNEQKTKKIHTYNKSWSKWVLNPTNVKVW